MKVIVLAGGKGTRLWPLSREKYSKQFLKLINGSSLLNYTYERALNLVAPEDVITITNKDYYFYVKDICSKFSNNLSKNIILEPAGRNTAPAIALAVKFIEDKMKASPNETLFVFPSDHIIKPMSKFIDYMKIAEDAANEGYLVTFGIKPDKPETGYGYIKKGESIGNFNKVERFTEKPDLETANKYIQSGNFYWNSGMFAFKISAFLGELKNYQPTIYKNVTKGYNKALEQFSNMPSISIDYAIMEKSKNVAVIPMDIFWSDLGSWDSFYEIQKKDENGNVILGDVEAVDTKNSLVFSNKRLVATVGIENALIIETDDALLVSKRGKGQDVKKLLDNLKKKQRKEVSEHLETYRPWGMYKLLEESKRYKIKRIVVKPGETLSLQMHYHRSEHWVVIRGTAKVTVGDKTYFVHEGESTFVPKTTLHRLANPGKVPLEIIEVQNGEYVGEDDIVRFEDKYGRVDKE